MRQLTIDEITPFIDVDDEDNIMFGRNGEITCGFKIVLPPIFTRDLSYYNELHKLFTDLISVLPNYARIHKQDFFSFKDINFESSNDYLKQQRQKMFAGKEALCRDSYIYITLVPPKYIMPAC